MRREPLALGQATWCGQQIEHLGDELPARDCRAVQGDLTGGASITYGERILQHRLHLAWPAAAGMRLGDLATPTDQMGQAGLMARGSKLSIGCPPIAHQHACKVGPEDRRGVVKAAAVLNRIDDSGRGGERPQPPELAGHFPTRFVGTHDRAAAHLLAEQVVGRRRLPRRPMERVGDSARPHVQPEPVAQPRCDLAVREAEVFIEQHDQRHGVRTQMRARRTEGIGRLQRMSPLHARPTAATAADMHIELAHVRPHDWQILLNLDRHPRFRQATAAPRTGGWERHVNQLVDGGWRLTMTMSAVAPTSTTTCWLRIRCRRPLRQRCRLSLTCALRSGELFLQPLVLALQPLARLFRFLKLPPQAIDFSIEVFGRGRFLLGRLAVVDHAPVMPESARRYKRNPLTSYGSGAVIRRCLKRSIFGFADAPTTSRSNKMIRRIFQLEMSDTVFSSC